MNHCDGTALPLPDCLVERLVNTHEHEHRLRCLYLSLKVPSVAQWPVAWSVGSYMQRRCSLTWQQYPGEDPNDLHAFHYLIYRHNDGMTYFMGPVRRPPELLDDGWYAHFIRSSVRGKRIPGKHDSVIAAGNYDDYVYFHGLELDVSRGFAVPAFLRCDDAQS